MRIGGIQPTSLVDYPGTVSSVIFTVGCNFRCPYCHNPELVLETPEREIPEEEIIAYLESHRHLVPGVVITGGEPTLQDDLLPFIERVGKMGFKVKLDTNGTHPAMLKEAIDRNLVQYVAMDIKSPLRKYAATVGAAVDMEAIVQSVAMLKEGKVDYEFRTTIVRSQLTPSDIEDIGKEIAGARKYYLQQFSPAKTLHPVFRKKLSYDREELEELAALVSPYVDYCGIRI